MDIVLESLCQGLPFRTMEYRSGEKTWPIQAVRGSISWGDIQRVGNAGLSESHHDFIVRGEDFADQKPRPKDKIADGDEEWTVYNLFTDECWRYVGHSQRLMRIHCRK